MEPKSFLCSFPMRGNKQTSIATTATFQEVNCVCCKLEHKHQHHLKNAAKLAFFLFKKLYAVTYLGACMGRGRIIQRHNRL